MKDSQRPSWEPYVSEIPSPPQGLCLLCCCKGVVDVAGEYPVFVNTPATDSITTTLCKRHAKQVCKAMKAIVKGNVE